MRVLNQKFYAGYLDMEISGLKEIYHDFRDGRIQNMLSLVKELQKKEYEPITLGSDIEQYTELGMIRIHTVPEKGSFLVFGLPKTDVYRGYAIKLSPNQTLRRHVMAEKISHEDENRFAHVLFTTTTCGAPENAIGVPELERRNIFRYQTNCNGNAYKGESVVICRDTGMNDVDDEIIYETLCGMRFVYKYTAGSLYSFCKAKFALPSLA